MSDVGQSVSRYRTIVADPPWPVGKWRTSARRKNNNGDGRLYIAHKQDLGYETMDVEAICALDVPAADDAHLYLWTTDAFLLDGSAARVAQAWGFKPLRCLVWVKPSPGLGVGWRPGHEIIVLARKGSLPFTFDVSLPTAFCMKQPYATGREHGKLHSAKPDGFLDYVEQASPGPYAELFARRARLGWDYPIGDQALGGRAA